MDPHDGGRARSHSIGERGIVTDRDFALAMSALMSDVLTGRQTPGVANAACNAGGKLLKVLELRHKYGTVDAQTGERKAIALIGGQSEIEKKDPTS